MAEKLRRRPMPATHEQRQFKIDKTGAVAFAPPPDELWEIAKPQPDDKPDKKHDKSPRFYQKQLNAQKVSSAIATALMRESQFNAPFIWCVICVGFGCLIYFTASAEIALQPIMFGLALFVLLIALAKERPTLKALSIYSACIVMGILLGKFETLTQKTVMLGSEVNTTISAHVLRFERLASGRKRLLLHVDKTKGPQLKYLKGALRLTYRGDKDYAPGDYIEGRARLFPPSGPVKPGGFDFAYQAYFLDLAATGILFGAPKKLSDPPPLSSTKIKARIFIERARQTIEERIKASLSGTNGDLASALVVGRKSAISDQANEALRATGLAHILSISGLHMVLAAGSAIFIVRLILAFFPAFSMAYNARKIASTIALGVATIYLAISGAGIATQRSYIMLAIILVALLFDRQALTMRNLAIAALLVLMVHPHEILNAGFHMSFAATAALIAAYSAMRTQKYQSQFFNLDLSDSHVILRFVKMALAFFGGLALTALIAGIATGLYSIYHFERFAPYGILANVLAMPIVTILIMPAGLLAMLAMPFDLDFYAWRVMGVGIDYVMRIAHEIAALTPDRGTGAMPKAAIIWGTLALLMLTGLRTRLALLAFIPIALSLISVQSRTLPIGYVHERGNTIGILTEGGDLALNRNRISPFVTDQWQRSLKAKILQGPDIERNTPFLALIQKMQSENFSQQFICNKDICLLATKAGGIRIAGVKTHQSLAELCTYLINHKALVRGPPLIVFEQIHIPIECEPFSTSISTAQERAFKGSIALYDGPIKTGGASEKVAEPFRLHTSFETIERPWHRHRAFSRAARNIEAF